MPFYERGTLEENFDNLGTPLERLRIFLAICKGTAYAHGKGLVHRDLKPANVFMADAVVPVVGDFGLCYRADEDRDERNTQTAEAVGARRYMPPEWREGRVETPQPTGDVYSLGKILYWMFEGRVFDGHEDDHSVDHPIVKTRPILLGETPGPQRWIIARLVAHELVGLTVRKWEGDRVGTVAKLIEQVEAAIDRVESDGRVLDINLPKRCLFCAAGTYQMPSGLPFPLPEHRRNPPARDGSVDGWPFMEVQRFVKGLLGFGNERPGPLPICLVCNVCGNIQYFRLDLTNDRSGQRWSP